MRAWLAGLMALALTSSHPTIGQSVEAPRAIDVTGFDATVARDEDDLRVAILCDPVKFRLSVRLADADSLDRTYPARMTIDPETLIQPLPNYVGEMQYRGQLIRYVQCGPYSIRLTGDFYNASIHGELGAYPSFTSVDIFADNSMLVPHDARSHVAIGECERDNRLAPDCPSGWAVRLDLDYDAKRQKVVVREQASSTGFLGGDRAKGRQRSERHYDVAASLEMWQTQASGTP